MASDTSSADLSSSAAPGHLQDRLRLPRRLRFTREGWYYFFFTLGVGVAALNTGNNLLFLVLGLQLTAIVVSGILSEICLQQLEVVRLPLADPCAGDPFLLSYEVRNRKRFWPTLTIQIAEKGAPFGPVLASLLEVGPGKRASASVQATAARRGRYGLDLVVVSTRFPFGLFEKFRDLSVPGELFVLPTRERPLEKRARGGYRDGERPEGKPGHGAEFLGFRELQAGDDRRLVHWRKSAAAGRLLAVEREREQRRRLVLRLDNRGPGGERLEAPVRQAAATARALSQRGLEVGLTVSGSRLEPAAGPVALRKLLRTLASLEAAPASGPAPVVRREGVLAVGAVEGGA